MNDDEYTLKKYIETINSLREECNRYKTALEKIADHQINDEVDGQLVLIANVALAPQSQEAHESPSINTWESEGGCRGCGCDDDDEVGC
jgi:hypothetical protein